MKVTFLFFIFSILFIASCSEDTSSHVLNSQETEWLEKHRYNIRIAPDPNDPPIEFFDEKGTYTGISADYIKLIEEKFEIKFKVVKLASFKEVMEKAKTHEIDIVTAISESKERKTFLNFTEPYVDDPIVIVVRKETTGYITTDNLGDRTLTYVKNYALHKELTENYSHLKLLPVTDERTGLRNVSFGVADAMIIDLPSASYYIEKDGLMNLRVAGDEKVYTKYSFAIRKDWQILHSIISKGLKSISEKQREQIRNKWIKLDYPAYWTSTEFILMSLLLIVAIIVTGLSFMFYRKRMSMKLEERINALIMEQSKTKDLEEKIAKVMSHMNNVQKFKEKKEKEELDPDREKYETTKLDKETLQKYLKILLEHMEEKKPYLNQSLTLNSLSEELSIYSHHISQLLSTCLDKNFNNFINEYRVEDVKMMFMDSDYDEDTILSIAYQSGFNSKATFNSIFKKSTGSTPSQYRKMCLKKRGLI
jgi:ABC-type amino acid transport substrate-binding protein/AraC-like DNA-binding protein